MLEFGGDRPPASFTLPAPQNAEALTMPRDEGSGLYDGQSVSPFEPMAEQHQRQASWIVGTSRFDLALLIKYKLLAQEQILGCD
jgi:hypothetical protein